jgi:hypothetical protein
MTLREQFNKNPPTGSLNEHEQDYIAWLEVQLIEARSFNNANVQLQNKQGDQINNLNQQIIIIETDEQTKLAQMTDANGELKKALLVEQEKNQKGRNEKEIT